MRFGRASEVLGGFCFGNNYKTDWVWSVVESSSYFVLSQISFRLQLVHLATRYTKPPHYH